MNAAIHIALPLIGLALGYVLSRDRHYRRGRLDGIEKGYADAIRDGWAEHDSLRREPQGRFYNQAEEEL